jgi:hypothetical protein
MKNKWVKVIVNHSLAGLLEDTPDGPLEVTKATTTLSKVVIQQVGGCGHPRGATQHHHPHHLNIPPAATIVDHLRPCRRMISAII